MGFLSSIADNLFGAATVPCVCPVKMLEQLKKLAPPIPPLPDIPIPKLEPLAPLIAAAPTPANNFVRERLELINNMRIPPALASLPMDHMKVGSLNSVPPFLRTAQKITGVKINDPKFEPAMRGSLLGLAKIPLPVPPPAAMPPAPPPIMQQLSATVTTMRMATAVLSLKLMPLDPSALAKIQVATKAAAVLPPFPAQQLAPLAPLASIARLAASMGIDLAQPGAVLKMANTLKVIAALPPAPPPAAMPALPAMLHVLSITQTLQNVATFFKLDLAQLSGPVFIAKVGVPLQPLVKVSESLSAIVSPAQAAPMQSWAAAAQFFPALQLMQKMDIGRLDLAPLADLPPIPNFGPVTAALALGETASTAAKKSGGAKCPQCPLA